MKKRLTEWCSRKGSGNRLGRADSRTKVGAQREGCIILALLDHIDAPYSIPNLTRPPTTFYILQRLTPLWTHGVLTWDHLMYSPKGAPPRLMTENEFTRVVWKALRV